MTSVYSDVIPQICKYDDTITIVLSGSVTKEIHRYFEMESCFRLHILQSWYEEKVRLENRWRSSSVTISDAHDVTLVTSWRHVMTWSHHASTWHEYSAWQNPAVRNTTSQRKYMCYRDTTSLLHRQCCLSTRTVMFYVHNDVTSWHHANTKLITLFCQLGKPESTIMKRKKKSISHSRLVQTNAEIASNSTCFCTSWACTSWRGRHQC